MKAKDFLTQKIDGGVYMAQMLKKLDHLVVVISRANESQADDLRRAIEPVIVALEKTKDVPPPIVMDKRPKKFIIKVTGRDYQDKIKTAEITEG